MNQTFTQKGSLENKMKFDKSADFFDSIKFGENHNLTIKKIRIVFPLNDINKHILVHK